MKEVLRVYRSNLAVEAAAKKNFRFSSQCWYTQFVMSSVKFAQHSTHVHLSVPILSLRLLPGVVSFAQTIMPRSLCSCTHITLMFSTANVTVRPSASGTTRIMDAFKQVCTVDAFQGAEKDIVIVATTRTERLGFIVRCDRIVPLPLSPRHVIATIFCRPLRGGGEAGSWAGIEGQGPCPSRAANTPCASCTRHRTPCRRLTFASPLVCP